MKKSTKLSLVLIGLIVISVAIGLSGKKENRNSFNIDMFSVEDTSAISRVLIASENEKEILRTSNGWNLNGEFKADPNLIQVLQSILSQVKVKRPVSKLNQEEIVQNLTENGIPVTVSFNGSPDLIFTAGGDGSKKKSYYLLDGKAYLVEIPGYQNYISGIFELSTNQWRDRVLFSSNWRSLVSLKIDYETKKEDLSVYFDKKFLTVEGVNKLDTVALMDYIGQLEYFQINDFLEKGKYKKYDSLANVRPMANLIIQDIDNSKNKSLKIYPLIQGEQFYLLSDQNDEMMVIDSKRMSNLLSSKDQFISK